MQCSVAFVTDRTAVGRSSPVNRDMVDGSDSVVHSYTSFHFTILIDVLLISSIPFLDLGTRYESLIVMTTMYGAPLKFTI